MSGALGYGLSSITVPAALLFYTNRTLSPALVWIEVVLNTWVLWINRASLPLVWRRVLPVVLGLLPGVVIGTNLLSLVSPDWLKLATFVVLLPPILAQAAGWRRPIRAERPAGLAFGSCVGVLYSVTTISGPPLAVMLSNQGLTGRDFRAALGLVRVLLAVATATSYSVAGMVTNQSLALLPWMLPSVAIGVPLGFMAFRDVRPETFRRLSMSFDAWVVGLGLSVVIRELGIVEGAWAFAVLAAVAAVDSYLLVRYFRQARDLADGASLAGAAQGKDESRGVDTRCSRT